MAPSDAPFAERHPLRILIAEDHYISRRLLLMLLQRLGYEAMAVENGRECMEAVMEHSFDLILTDIDMPEMDGFECTKCLRRAGLEIPIIAITANRQYTLSYYLGAGMNGYLSKPFNMSQLQMALREAFREKKTESASYLDKMETQSLALARL